ncbi:response regulator [Bengtsoniella intestinalis]|uniref:response regulator transcription factor n=1 Tax=Bengtsoniella intestinalis TaxID=3073143 RepID=UPI00391F6A96
MYTVLFADDEEHIKRALLNAVDWAELGFEIVADVSNGIEAMEYIEKYDIDLLVTDIKMPIMGGIELARAAREIRPSMQIVFLSGHEEFEFAKQAIRYNILEYLLKPITTQQILREFANIKQKLDHNFSEILNIDDHHDMVKELENTKRDLLVTRLIQDGLTPSQLKDALDNIALARRFAPEDDMQFVLFLVKSEYLTPSANTEEGDRRVYNITKIISQKYLNCICSLYRDFSVVIAYGAKDTLTQYLPILSKDIVLSAKRVINAKTYVVQSEFYDTLTQSHLAFRQAYNALSIMDKSSAQIVQIRDIAAIQEPVIQSTETLSRTILAGDSPEVEEVLNIMFASAHQNDITLHSVTMQVLSVLFRISGTLEHNDREGILRMASVNLPDEEMKRELLTLSLSITQKILARREKSVDTLCKTAIDIIHDEFSNPEISLGYIANQIHCSPNYLSSIIKKTTGNSFVDILTQVRMETANTLLLTTNQKIRNISEACGYANQHYFSYSFKKYFDKSPNTVRKEKTM